MMLGARTCLTAALSLLVSCAAGSPSAPKPAPVARATPGTAGAAGASSGTMLALSRADAQGALCRVFAELDRDCDRRITVEDLSPRVCPDCAARPAFPHSLSVAGTTLELRTTSEASQLVQELVLGLTGESYSTIRLDLKRVQQNPSDYLAQRIDRDFWSGLTRRIDPDPAELSRALADEKLGEGPTSELELCPAEVARCPAPAAAPKPEAARERHVYVPGSDAQALLVFSKSGVPGSVAVHALPTPVTPEWVTETTQKGEHGLLTLALDKHGRGLPFVVPGGRFNELYGWDSFFIVWGLLAAGDHLPLARAIVENQAYEIRHYGKILNANRTYYLTRSQPPLFTSSIAAVLDRLPAAEKRAFLEHTADQALFEYDRVWSAPPHRLGLCEGETCLARYFDPGEGEPPEVEPGHFDWFYQNHALSHGHCRKPGADREGLERFLRCSEQLAADYRAKKLKDAQIDAFFSNDRCVRESGHDTTYRWYEGGRERCADHAPVELNAMLFKYEVDLARFIDEHLGGRFQGRTGAEFCERARARARLMQKFNWDEQGGAFFDYDVKKRRRSTYFSATTLVPLWASGENRCGASLVSGAMAPRLRERALKELEVAGGLTATAASSRTRVDAPRALVRDANGGLSHVTNERQWESPNGWAPHQMFAWAGLSNFGFERDAHRLAYRWLSTIVSSAADYHGTVPEKFDVVRRSHRVLEEYGNVNTEFSYIATEGFGWMNASFVVGRGLLDAAERAKLAARAPVEQVFPEAVGNEP